MPILKSLITPSGATIGYHVFQRFEAQAADPSQSILVSIASWPTQADYERTDGKSAAWNDWYPLPFSALLGAAGSLTEALENALTLPGAAFDGGSIVSLSNGIDAARQRRWVNIKQQRELLDSAPISVDGIELDADGRARMDIMGAIMAMQLTGETTREWRCADNVMRTLTLAEIVGVGTGIAARRQVLIETSDALYKAIQAATTPEQVAAVVWPA